MLAHLARLRPDVVITGSYAGYDFTPEQWVNGSSRVLAALSAAAQTVVLIPGTPALDFDGPGCAAAQTTRGAAALLRRRDCRTTGNLARVAQVRRHLQAASTGHPNVLLLDLGDLVCPAGICAAQDTDGRIVFRDNQHLTDSFVRAQAPAVAARLRALGIELGAGAVGSAPSAHAGP